MGGHLTVSSKENHGSTFTFILPCKVSTTCDNSDYSDELSDMENDDTFDDTTEGFFQFQPCTLGSLFSSNGSGRSQKLLPHKIGYTSSHKFNVFSESSYSLPFNDIISRGTCSVGEESSVIDAQEMSESASSSSPETKSLISKVEWQKYKTHAWSLNGSEDSHQPNREMVIEMKSSEPQQTCHGKEKANTTTHYVSSSGTSEVTKPTLKPKILLVEDNKINVMVAQSMMKQLGHSIDVVNNGAEAVRAVQHCTYDLILMVISRSMNCILSQFPNFSL